MATPDETEIICECRHTSKDESAKDSFNNAPNIHEIDEEKSETEETTILEQPNPALNEDDHVAHQETKDASDNESYTGDSFCSDESCDESEVASGSLNPSLLRIADHSRSRSSKELDEDASGSRWKDEESYLMSNESSRAATADRLIRPRKCRRWNMSFTDEEMRKIERENELLLRKIMAQQKPRQKILGERSSIQPRISSSAINRKKLQKRIEDDNLLLLKRIQQAKSCVFANTSKMGCRLTFL